MCVGEGLFGCARAVFWVAGALVRVRSFSLARAQKPPPPPLTHAHTTNTHTNTQTQGFVYVKFEAVEAAVAARAALHGRFYSGLQIHAEFQFERLYSSVFHC